MSSSIGDGPQSRRKVNSPGRLAFRRFMRHRLAVFGALIVLLAVALSILLPFVMDLDPNAVDPRRFRQAPSPGFPLGNDSAGRDVLARLIYGGRVSLSVGLAAAVTATTIGLALGTIAGLIGGVVDTVISRLTDIVLSFPTLIVIIVVVAFTGPSIGTLIIAIGCFEWPTAARIVRGQTLSLREQEFVDAVAGLGAGRIRLLLVHIMPAVIPPLTVVATLLVAQAILLEAALSFLGLGVPPSVPSWGTMLNEAQSLTILETMPWLWLPPGLAIAVVVMSVNFIGDGLRDAVDPRAR
jgi:ABC-type dipeptide/oligopeptide/nickel transport system permease subunit